MRSRAPRSSRRPPRPRLFLLVYGATVLLVCLTIAGLALVVSQHLTASAIRSIVAGDRSIVREFLDDSLGREDFSGLSRDAAAGARLDATMAELVERRQLVGLRAISPTGVVVASANRADRGVLIPLETRLQDAFDGAATAEMTTGPLPGATADGDILSEYWPVITAGGVPVVVELRRNGGPIARDADAIRRDVALLTGSAALLLALLLYVIYRGAQLRLARQTRELIESTRRDALTGLLNHGAVVERLAATLENARRLDGPVGVALVDIDNFRLLNDVHGHDAGDAVLQKVVRAIDEEPGSWATVGRYGPDEFMLISHPGAARELEPAAKRLRQRLEAVTVQFGRSERLPVTVSVGIAHFPFHADSVTELLSEATIALGEAKASGGDALRVAGAWDKEPGAERDSFGILHGLVIAVDTKDRYTKRHSEDVARYALFLADQIGLDDKLRETLRVAGLLHDVGKIGIPDDILRKPSELTPYEYEIVKQHVALGDLIVRDLPNLWLVRAGIKHHHERWDGTGYLDQLAGEKIPLIARILSVGDAFSAMTTSRPYRKAFPVEAALKRLEDVAGTQLDPSLVSAFVNGIRSVSGAPLPGADAAGNRLWQPTRTPLEVVA
jgi:diguanylate cyclase (GGDEF)-like protein